MAMAPTMYILHTGNHLITALVGYFLYSLEPATCICKAVGEPPRLSILLKRLYERIVNHIHQFCPPKFGLNMFGLKEK